LHPRVTIRRSKTDQEGAGATVAIVRGSVACPVEALKVWLGGAGITEGAIFRRVNKGGKVLPERLTAQSVALIVKAHARRAGLDPRVFAGHSLRSGAAELTEREREARISDRRRRVAAIARESREYRMIAQIFPMHHAVGTNATGVAEPRNADTLANAQALDFGTDRVDTAYDLVARDNRNVRVGQFAVDDMKVGTANSTGTHLDSYLARPGLPIG
jgi:hypothetical protein